MKPNITSTPLIPLWLKLTFTAFMAVLIPVYWANYGPTNFLYFCDVAMFIALFSLWTESAFGASAAAVGIVLPQIFWCADFVSELSGHPLSGMTHYMFDASKPLLLRGLSLFHGWLPFLLLFLVARLGYDKRGLPAWTGLAWVLCLIAYFFLPPAGAEIDPNLPRNVDYVFGLDDTKQQQLCSPGLFLIGWMLTLFLVLFVPTHFALKRLFGTKTALA
jgi:hypothetical protein